ncbi:hypothetical protein AAMO2058_001551100 [Amorphochlora amoebiformis]
MGPKPAPPKRKATFVMVNETAAQMKADDEHKQARIPKKRGENKRVGDTQASPMPLPSIRQLAEQVNEMGSRSVSKKDNRAYELKRLLKIGAKVPKGQKMPMRMAIGIAEKRKRKEREQRELDRAMGLSVGKKRRKKNKLDHGLKISMGYEKDGMVKVSRRQREEVAVSARRTMLKRVLRR